MDLHLLIHFPGFFKPFIAAGSLYENNRNPPARCDQIHGSLIVVNIHLAKPAAHLLIGQARRTRDPGNRQAGVDGMVTAVLISGTAP
jgi:hypothetical protein